MSSNSTCGSSFSSGRRQMKIRYEGNTRYCGCEIEGKRLKAPRSTSWTDENPGRRFYGCRNWKTKNCGYFEWHDEPMTQRAKEVINELKKENLKLVKMNESSHAIDVKTELAQLWEAMQGMKEEYEKVRKKSRIVSSILIASWLLLVAFFFVA